MEVFELQNRDQEYGEEYDHLDRETLDGLYDDLLEKMNEGDMLNDDLRRMEYIDSIRREAEYSLIDDVPDPKFDGRTINAQITRDKKDFFSKHLGVVINVKDGPASAKLIHEMRITVSVAGKQNGILFEGSKVLVYRGGDKPFDYSDSKNKKISSAVKNFKKTI